MTFFWACVTGSCDLHANRFTYEVAPVFVLLEYVTLKKMREIIGWQDGRGDGIFSPGMQLSISMTFLVPRLCSDAEMQERESSQKCKGEIPALWT